MPARARSCCVRLMGDGVRSAIVARLSSLAAFMD